MFWLKSGLFAVGLGMSFVYAIIPPLARDLGLSEIQASFIFSLSALRPFIQYKEKFLELSANRSIDCSML